MNTEFWKGVAAGIIRLLLAGVAGYLVKTGAVTSWQWDIIVGALASIVVAVIWSVMQKYGVDQLIGTALRMPSHATREQLMQVSSGEATVDVFGSKGNRPDDLTGK